MGERKLKKVNGGGSGSGAHFTVWDLVIPYVKDPFDRGSISLVCKRWYEIDAITRRHVTIDFCYTAEPERLSRRFPYLELLKIKGKPRASMFSLIPKDWGGFVRPWVDEILRSFPKIKALHFRRMIVKDSDLELLATSAGGVLEVLRLDNCSGFSTDGLLIVCRMCRKLRTLFLEESLITEKDAQWLHELALNNTSLESLNFYMTDLEQVAYGDLELIARRCPSLVSMQICDCDLSKLIRFFKAATSLEEFGGVSFSMPPAEDGEAFFDGHLESYGADVFPPKLWSLCPTFLGNTNMPILYPVASRFRKLDLIFAFMLDAEGHFLLLQRCPNLEVLEVRNVIGDRGFEVIGEYCKKLKRLRIERGAGELDIEDEEGVISQRGLVALAKGCPEIEYMAVHVSDITNASLECIGSHSKNLRDFRLTSVDIVHTITDLTLDNGVRSLLRGCQKLRRLALCLHPRALTDSGLAYIGRYSPNVRCMHLGCLGGSDEGLLEFSRGCRRLEKLEVIGCRFSEGAIALAALQLPSLRFLWVKGYRASVKGQDLLTMVRPHWNIELMPATRETVPDPDGGEGEMVLRPHAHILAYYSLAGQRTDFPATFVPMDTGHLLRS